MNILYYLAWNEDSSFNQDSIIVLLCMEEAEVTLKWGHYTFLVGKAVSSLSLASYM